MAAIGEGELLSGRYRLDEPIATGGMGQVWRATDVALGRVVAVKVLHPRLFADPSFDARFRAEARILAALTHPNVVNIYDYGHSPLSSGDRVAYLVMTYVHGQPLAQRLAAGPLSVAETMSVVAQAGEALHAAHQGGHIHRDVKPANLVVQPDGTVILVDFGVAHSPTIASATTGPLVVLGTANYMAPEQAVGRTVSAATDVYALGAVAYHCLTGQPPFHGDTALAIMMRHISDEPTRLPPHVPPAVRLLIARALDKNPANRYPSAAALATAARGAARRTGAGTATRTRVPAPPDIAGDTTPLPARRLRTGHLGLAAAVIALLLLCVPALALAFGSARTVGTSPPRPPGTSARPMPSTAAAPQPAQLSSPRSAAPRRTSNPGTAPALPSTATPNTTPPTTTPPSPASPTRTTPTSPATTPTPVASTPANSVGPFA